MNTVKKNVVISFISLLAITFFTLRILMHNTMLLIKMLSSEIKRLIRLKEQIGSCCKSLRLVYIVT